MRIKTFCCCDCFCKPNLQRIIKPPKAHASMEESATEQGKTQLDTPFLVSSTAHSLQRQLPPACIHFSRFNRTGRSQKSSPQLHSFSQGCELHGQTEPMLRCNVVLALCSGFGATCGSQLQTQSHTWPHDQPKMAGPLRSPSVSQQSWKHYYKYSFLTAKF